MSQHRRAGSLLAVALVAAVACAEDEPSTPAATFSTTPSVEATSDPTEPPTGPPVTQIDTTDPTSTAPTPPPTEPGPLADPVVRVELVAALAEPVDLAIRPGDERLFVVRQVGSIVALDADGGSTEVLDATNLTAAGGEQGLLGLAFHPSEPLAYINYTDGNGATNVDEFTVAADGSFDVESRRNLLTIEQPYPNHNGGDLAFGPDGLLYIATGDGGAGGDPQRYALDLSSLLGKMLRIDPSPSANLSYTVPTDNPFIGVDGARPEIWSVGLRNPWRFSFDAATGDLWIADVGQGEWEEINVSTQSSGGGRGVNYGWSAFEGTRRFNDDQPADGATPPVFEYPHGEAGCSISGGEVYRGDAIAELVGWFVYADYCSGTVSALRLVDGTPRNVTLGQLSAVSAVAAGPDGTLYVLSLDSGVHRITL